MSWRDRSYDMVDTRSFRQSSPLKFLDPQHLLSRSPLSSLKRQVKNSNGQPNHTIRYIPGVASRLRADHLNNCWVNNILAMDDPIVTSSGVSQVISNYCSSPRREMTWSRRLARRLARRRWYNPRSEILDDAAVVDVGNDDDTIEEVDGNNDDVAYHEMPVESGEVSF